MPYIDTHVALQLRDVGDTLTPNDTQKTTLIVGGCYIVAIAILWHVKYLKEVLYPFKLLTVSMHEFSHAFAGILTCANIQSIEMDPDAGGVTRMTYGVSAIVLPAGYIGSSLIGACLIACGFDTNASKVAMLVLGSIFLMSLWWARRDGQSWVLILCMSGLILAFWFIGQGIALRYLVLFIGVMSCMYALWDTIGDIIKERAANSDDAKKAEDSDDTKKPDNSDDTKKADEKKVNKSDASEFAMRYKCCPPLVWGVIWTIIAFIFFAGGVLVGLAVFKLSAAQQVENSKNFIPNP